jgi:hypothetical protein
MEPRDHTITGGFLELEAEVNAMRQSGQLISRDITRLSQIVQQMNERLMTVERTVNTLFVSLHHSDRHPADDVFERDFKPQPQQVQTIRGQLNVKHARSGDLDIHRIELPGKRWLVVKTSKGSFEEAYIDDPNEDEVESLELDQVEEMIGSIPDIVRTRPMGDDPDPNFDSIKMNPERE